MAKRDPLGNFIKLNIGLKKGQTNQDVPLPDVHDQLAKHGFTTTRERVVTKQRTGGEPTAVIHARHTMPQADAEKAVHDMSGALGQDAIAYRNNRKGVLSGPRKENYGGHFNSKFFTEGRLDELSPDTLASYLRHATVSHGSNTMRLGQEGVYNIEHNRPIQSGDDYAKAKKGADKRFSGIQTAISKLHRNAMHEDHVSRGDRVSVSDPEGDWTGRVFKPGRDSLFGGGASREDAMHQITPDPQHANRFPRSVVSVHPDAVHRVYEDHLDEISIESLRNYMDAAIRNELDATHGAQDLRKQHHQRSIHATLTTDHRGNKLKSNMQALVDRAARRRRGVSLARERLALQTEGKDQ